MELSSLIYLKDAIEKGKSLKPNFRTKNIPVEESVGLYASQEIRSPSDFPLYDRSAVDGFALRANETISSSKLNPSVFRIVGNVTASSPISRTSKGTAVKIATGGRIPEGSDSVVMKEETEEEGDILKVYSPVRRFQNVSRRGEDLKEGVAILKKGRRVNPAHVAALIESGIGEVSVFDLSIGILSTGDELVSGLVKNSTQPFIKALIESRGFHAKSYGVVQDDGGKILSALESMDDDIIIVTGGSGPGEMDLLPEIVSNHGKLIFRGIRIRPGRTTGLGVINGKPIFMVSGLPVAAMIAIENVMMPLLSLWLNLFIEPDPMITGKLERSVVNPVGIRSFVRVKVEKGGDASSITPTRTTGSGVVYSILESDGILEVEENSEGIEAGENVTVKLMRWWG
ncbi:MAG: molybdopterin molybdotransferase MoeA [Thermoplasmatales archaeon]